MVELDFDPDVDYAQGYYDGLQRMPPARITASYLRGHEDGWHDQVNMPTWSEEYTVAQQKAYTLWMDAKEDEILQ